MSTALASPPRLRRLSGTEWREPLKRLAPTLAAAVLAGVYVIVSPPSLDLAAHLFRARLFAAEGFGLWDNWWYSGHSIVGYSVLFPAISAELTPQLAGALAAVATAALFEPLARRHFGADAWLGALLFGVATAIDLYTGRLALAFGALPALGAVVALDRGRVAMACGLAVLAALCSPVAALFAALAAAGIGLGACLQRRPLRDALSCAAVGVAALAPVWLVAIAFPEGGTEPFAVSTLWPILVLSAIALVIVPREQLTLRAGIALYAAATLAVYLVPTPIGSNIVRLGTFLAAPLAALLWWRRRTALIAVLPLLLYIGWQDPVRDVWGASTDPSSSPAYYQPLLGFLRRESVPPSSPFRIEIPFTQSHWEAYVVATHFPLARGWERQLDTADNPLFYRGHLTSASYEHWLHENAIRFVAAPDAPLDYSSKAEMALISHGLPYLHLVMRSSHWRVFGVVHPTPIVQGAATLRAMGPNWLTLQVHARGSVLVRVRFSPYWALSRGAGCVGPAGAYTRLTLQRSGTVKLAMAFSLTRIAATSARCR